MVTNCASQVLSGLAKDCSNSMGGIRAAYITAHENVVKPTVDEGGGKIATLTLTSPSEETKKFKKYALRKNTGSMSSNFNIDYTNGTNYVTTNCVLSFLRMEATKQIEMTSLTLNELAVIVQDSNGKFWYLGFDEPVTATAGTGETGTAKADGNKYTVTLTDEANQLPYEIEASAVEAVVDTL